MVSQKQLLYNTHLPFTHIFCCRVLRNETVHSLPKLNNAINNFEAAIKLIVAL